MCIRDSYYATPDTWCVPHALEKVVVPLNRWVMAEAGRQPDLAGMATTLTVLVLRGRRYVCAHVGDSRLYLLRDGVCTRLTSDHVWDHPELRSVLSRAVGLDRHFQLDFFDGELQQGDCFLLCSDGVWGPLGSGRIRAALLAHPDAQQAAASLTSLAPVSYTHLRRRRRERRRGAASVRSCGCRSTRRRTARR